MGLSRRPSISVRRLSQIQLQLKDYVKAMEKIYDDAYLTPEWPLVLTYVLGATGRRLGEALALRTIDIDWEAKRIMWKIEKKRQEFYLALPASDKLLKLLDRYIRLNAVSYRLFDVSRQRAWYKVKQVLARYGLRGWRPHDLRHAFILKALVETKSLELVRRWVAHSKYDLLRQYADVVGLEFDRPLVEL
ncbi:MAG: site-specific integrase [Pyrobaculum sp.]